jgi:hypothetical protein
MCSGTGTSAKTICPARPRRSESHPDGPGWLSERKLKVMLDHSTLASSCKQDFWRMAGLLALVGIGMLCSSIAGVIDGRRRAADRRNPRWRP